MTIEEVKLLKKKSELEIANIIYNLNIITGCNIDNIDLRTLLNTDGRIIITKLEIKMEL